MRRAIRHFAIKRSTLAGGLLLAVASSVSANDREAAAPAIAVSAPTGFEGLATLDRAVVEVFSGGQYLGTADVRIRPGTIRFLQPDTLVARLADLKDVAPVLRYLSDADLASNTALLCPDSAAPADCGTLAPQVAGVIFDPNRLRADLFVNPAFLSGPRRQDEYLPDPEGKFGLLGETSLVVSGSGSDRLANLQTNSIASFGATRMRADLALATDLGFQADRLLVERDLEGMRASAGAMWSPGSGLIARRKFLGFGLESQTDTRRDRLQVEGSPLVVFLDERARVDVLRDGKIIATGVYAPGNQLLDTSGMPEGSYDLTIRVHNSRGGLREERRLFTKQTNIAVQGFDRFRFQAGLAIDSRSAGSLNPTESPFVEGYWAHRVSEKVAVDATAGWSGGRFNSEVGAFFLSPLAVVRLAAVGFGDAIRGGIIQARSTGASPLNFSVDVRHLQGVEFSHDGHLTQRHDHLEKDVLALQAAEILQPHAQSAITQLAGNVSYSLPQAQFFVSGTYTAQDGDERDTYSVGPSVRWRLFERGQVRVLFDGSLSLTDRGQAGFAGLSLTLTGRRSSTGVQIGHGYASSGMREARRGAFLNLDQSVQLPAFAGGDLSLAGFAQRSSEGELLGASSEYRNEAVDLSAEAIGGSGSGHNALQYTLAGRAGYFLGSGEAGIVADVRADSRAVVRITGARESDAFEVFVDQSSAGRIVGNESLSLALPSYRSYSVRIKHASPGSVSYDGRAREVTVFPGQVAGVDWKVTPTALVYGRLVGADRLPVAYASLSAAGAWGESDANGYFQIEAAGGAELKIQLPDGRALTRVLPDFAVTTGTFRLGELSCCTETGRPQIAVNLPEQSTKDR